MAEIKSHKCARYDDCNVEDINILDNENRVLNVSMTAVKNDIKIWRGLMRYFMIENLQNS